MTPSPPDGASPGESSGSSTPTVLAVHPGAEMFGSDRMLLESVAGLREAGARVVVAVPSDGPLVPALQGVGAEVVIIPLLVLRKSLLRPSGWPRLLRDAFRGLGAAWRLLGRVRPDAVYVSTIILPEWPVIARLRGVPVVSHVHEAEASAHRLVTRALYLPHLASDRVLVNSRFTLATIASSLPALARRARVVYNGVAGPVDPPPPRSAIDGPLRILYVGRLSPRKGPDLVLSAARIMARAGGASEVTLLGGVFPGYEWYETELRDAAAAASSEVRVTFAGFQPDIWPYLADCDVLVVPSRLDESFGNTAVEGILALRPVIASDTSGLPEATHGYSAARIVRADDSDAIATALVGIRDDWARLVEGVDADRAEALRRHAPAHYRTTVSGVVLHRG